MSGAYLLPHWVSLVSLEVFESLGLKDEHSTAA